MLKREWHRVPVVDGRPDLSSFPAYGAVVPCAGELWALALVRFDAEVSPGSFLCNYGDDVVAAIAAYDDMGVPEGWTPGRTKV